MHQGEDDTDLPLFREEAQAEQQERWLGPVMLDQKLSPLFVSLAFAAFVVIALSAAIFSDYTRRTTMSGWLVPEAGLTNIQSPIQGNVDEIFVKEGDVVAEGDPILTIVSELANENGTSVSEQKIASLLQQKQTLDREVNLQKQLSTEQTKTAQMLLDNYRNQQRAITNELQIEVRRVSVGRTFLSTQRQLYEQELITQERLLQYEDAQLDKNAVVERLKQQQAIMQSQLNETEAIIRTAPILAKSNIAQLERQIQAIDQQLASTEIERAIVLKAPKSGVVASLQTNSGARTSAGAPLVTVIPQGAILEAHLYAPSRSIGLVEAGQSVSIRYEAFPFQRFGTFSGEVISISQSTVSSNEITTQILGGASNVNSSEPLYVVRVKLDHQEVYNGDTSIPLRAGHRLNVDIKIDTQPVYKWVLAPIFTFLSGDEE